MRIAAASFNPTPLDWRGNRGQIQKILHQAHSQAVDVLCLPELCLTGYGCEDLFLSQDFCERAWRELMLLLPHTERILVTVGLPVVFQSKIYNAVAILAAGRLVALIPKQNLARDGIHYEPRWFTAWPRGDRQIYLHKDLSVPIGDFLIRLKIGDEANTLGVEICEDAWVAYRPAQALAQRGATLILNPSASHFALHKVSRRISIVLEASRKYVPTYVYANLLGNEAGRVIYDGDLYIAHRGEILASAPRLTFKDSQMICVDLFGNASRTQVPSDDILEVQLPSSSRQRPPFAISPPDSYQMSQAEEFARAVSLGLWDYLRKTRAQGAVVSLSGGADSAAVSLLMALAPRFALIETDETTFRNRWLHLAFLKDELQPLTVESVVAHILTCAYQATDFSSDVTRRAAESVARGLGARFLVWNIQPIVDQYCMLIEKALGRSLDWSRDDVALQNIQARARSPGIWMLANIENKLLLATSNRSEAAVGYATMDGDTSGGLAPLAGIDKTFLREWLEMMEKEGLPPHIPPMPFLREVNQQKPTAELRPREAQQTDEADLMPYFILDTIEDWAIRDRRFPQSVFNRLIKSFHSQTKPELLHYTSRFYRLWCQNQWKRERFAPSFHLDDHNVDPRSWCRFPILNGAFESELGEIQARGQNINETIHADDPRGT